MIFSCKCLNECSAMSIEEAAGVAFHTLVNCVLAAGVRTFARGFVVSPQTQ